MNNRFAIKALFIMLIAQCVLLFSSIQAGAGGPKSTFPEPRGLDSEFVQVYHDIANPVINIGSASTMTVTYLNVSTITALSESVTNSTINNLTVTGSVTGINGRFVQMKSTSTAATDSTASNTFVNSSLSGQITPTSTASTMTIVACSDGETRANGDTFEYSLSRNGTNLGGTEGLGQIRYNVTVTNLNTPFCFTFNDFPNTTSSVNYFVTYRSRNAATVVLNDFGMASYMYFYEIK